jgi:hypothetical protein
VTTDIACAQGWAVINCFLENIVPSFAENIHPEGHRMALSDSSSGDENHDTRNRPRELDGIQNSVEVLEEVHLVLIFERHFFPSKHHFMKRLFWHILYLWYQKET